MNHKIKIQLDKKIVRVYHWRKTFWLFGAWEPIYNCSHIDEYEAYGEYAKLCKSINPFFKPTHK